MYQKWNITVLTEVLFFIVCGQKERPIYERRYLLLTYCLIADDYASFTDTMILHCAPDVRRRLPCSLTSLRFSSRRVAGFSPFHVYCGDLLLRVLLFLFVYFSFLFLLCPPLFFAFFLSLFSQFFHFSLSPIRSQSRGPRRRIFLKFSVLSTVTVSYTHLTLPTILLV